VKATVCCHDNRIRNRCFFFQKLLYLVVSENYGTVTTVLIEPFSLGLFLRCWVSTCMHLCCKPGIINVLMTTPLWVANTRLKLQGTKLQTGTSSDHGCSPRVRHTNYSGLIGKLSLRSNHLSVQSFHPGRGVAYCDEYVCLCACLHICQRAISKSLPIFCTLLMAVAQFFEFPVLCQEYVTQKSLYSYWLSRLWCCCLGGRKGIRPVKNWVMGCWRRYPSGASCRLAYIPSYAAATHCLLLQ